MNKFRPLFSEHSDFLPEEPLGESIFDLEKKPVRVWRPKSTIVVLGRSQKAEKEIFLEATQKDSIPIFKRHGGGGCVILDENCICIALRYKRDGKHNDTDFLKHSSLGVQLFLKETYDLDVEIKENYDLLLNGRKFLGASLYMPKGYCYYSAVMLFDREAMNQINKYLSMPSKEPKHREGRTHEDFLIPLGEHIECTFESITRDLQEFMEETDWVAGP